MCRFDTSFKGLGAVADSGSCSCPPILALYLFLHFRLNFPVFHIVDHVLQAVPNASGYFTVGYPPI